MGADVVLRLAAEEAGWINKMRQARAEALAFGSDVELVDKRGNKAKQSLAAMAGQAVVSTVKVAAAFAGVGSAIAAIATASRMVMDEYEQWRSRRTDAAGAFRKLPDLERKMADSLDPTDDLGLDQVRDALMRYGDKYHVSMDKLISSMTSALGGKGREIPASIALQAVEAQAKHGPFADVDEFSGNPGRFLDWVKQFGGTPEQQMAMGIEAQRLARDEDSAKFWQSGGAAIAQGKAFGWDQQHGMALYAAVTQGALDKEGRLSANMVVQFEKQLLEATAHVKELAGKSGPERLDYIRGDQGATIRYKLLGELAGDFPNLSRADRKRLERQVKKEGIGGISKLHGEAKPFATALSLVDPDAPDFAYRAYQESYASTSKSPAEALEKLLRNRQQLNQSVIQQLAHKEALTTTQIEQNYLKQPGLAAQGIDLEALPDLFKSQGQTALGRKLANIRRLFAMKSDILGEARAVEEELAKHLGENAKAEKAAFDVSPVHAARARGFMDPMQYKGPSEKAKRADELIENNYRAFKAERERLEAIEAERRFNRQRGAASMPSRARFIAGPNDVGQQAAAALERATPKKPAEPLGPVKAPPADAEVPRILKEIRDLLRGDQKVDRPTPLRPSPADQSRVERPIPIEIKVSDAAGREINRATARVLPVQRLG